MIEQQGHARDRCCSLLRSTTKRAKENRALAGPVQYASVGAPATPSRGEQLPAIKSPIWEDGGDPTAQQHNSEYAIPTSVPQCGRQHVSHAVIAQCCARMFATPKLRVIEFGRLSQKGMRPHHFNALLQRLGPVLIWASHAAHPAQRRERRSAGGRRSSTDDDRR
jgi:hypothetical protein